MPDVVSGVLDSCFRPSAVELHRDALLRVLCLFAERLRKPFSSGAEEIPFLDQALLPRHRDPQASFGVLGHPQKAVVEDFGFPKLVRPTAEDIKNLERPTPLGVDFLDVFEDLSSSRARVAALSCVLL